MQDVSIFILNYNGLEFLKKCIPSVIKATDFYTGDSEITVIDNGSTDGSINYLKNTFPQIRIIALKENLGFAAAMNIGIKESTSRIVIGLNNDVIVEDDFIGPLVKHFTQPDIFAVGPKMLLWDRKTLNFGRAIGKFKIGIFRRRLTDSYCAANTLYICGGGFAVDRNKFLELDGFDEDMIDFWEDADLCYRAWKRGWRTIYEPQSIIYHKLHGTYAKKYNESGLKRISSENYFLFMLKNIHDKMLFYQQLFFLPALIPASLLLGKPHFAIGFLKSLKRWPLFYKKRQIEKRYSMLSDWEVFKISSR